MYQTGTIMTLLNFALQKNFQIYIVSYNGQIKVVEFSELDVIYLEGFFNLQIYKCCPHLKTKPNNFFFIHLFMSCSPEHI